MGDGIKHGAGIHERWLAWHIRNEDKKGKKKEEEETYREDIVTTAEGVWI